MTKPWEETWELTERGDHDFGDGAQPIHYFNQVINGQNLDTFFDEPALMLASAAPDMARMILRILDNEAECPVCREGVYWDDRTDKRVQPHLAACELQAVLRKAGVLRHSDG